jgi:hypothetical protein
MRNKEKTKNIRFNSNTLFTMNQKYISKTNTGLLKTYFSEIKYFQLWNHPSINNRHFHAKHDFKLNERRHAGHIQQAQSPAGPLQPAG